MNQIAGQNSAILKDSFNTQLDRQNENYPEKSSWPCGLWYDNEMKVVLLIIFLFAVVYACSAVILKIAYSNLF